MRNAPVDTLYCLGMPHCYDIANGSWYHPTDDFGMYHFIGDRVGSMELTFADSEIMTLPLVRAMILLLLRMPFLRQLICIGTVRTAFPIFPITV